MFCDDNDKDDNVPNPFNMSKVEKKLNNVPQGQIKEKTLASTFQKESNTPATKKEDKKYKCTYEGCNASFPRPYRLNNHLLTHGGEKWFKCSVDGCEKAYTSQSHLKRHVATSHSTVKERQTFMCNIVGCGKVLKSRDILLKHTHRAHSDETFECKVCGMKFRTTELLASHSLKSHKNQTSHRCEKCKKTFLKIGCFNRHIRGHRLHVCQFGKCLFVTDDYSQLRKHVAVKHRRFFQCASCGKEVKDKSLIRKHVRVHLLEEGLIKPKKKDKSTPALKFSCSLCSQILTTKGSLKRHVMVMHEKSPESRVRQVKRGSERAPRKDKGIPRKSIASQLAFLTLPNDINKAIINDDVSKPNLVSRKILDVILQNVGDATEV